MAYEMHTGSADPYFRGLTPNASAHVKGVYEEVAASTGFATSHWWVHSVVQTGQRLMLFDVATGAAASEVVLLADLLSETGQDAGGASPTDIEVEVDVAISTRLSGRTQANVGSGIVGISILLHDRATASIPSTQTYGNVNATSRGTTFDPGGTVDTKGAYAELTASTTAALDWLTIMTGLRGNTAPAFYRWAVDLATGAASSEVVVIPDMTHHAMDLGSDNLGPQTRHLPIEIATSTRIAVRAQCLGNNSFDRQLEMVLLAGDVPTPVPTSAIHVAGTVRRS